MRLVPMGCIAEEVQASTSDIYTALNNLVKTSLASIDTPATLEPPGLFRSDGKRVDGVTIVPWKLGYALAWDVTCSNIFAPTYVSLASSGAGKVANLAKTRKKQRYWELEPTHHFIPIAIETSGTFGDEALAFFKELGYCLRSKTQEPQSFHQISQRISVCMQRFNSISILGSSAV